jgi:hypothetical protein
MYINYSNTFSIKLSGIRGGTWIFLEKEYHYHISQKPKNKVQIHISFQSDKICKDEYIVREPVSYDEKGVYVFDKNGNKSRLNFDDLNSKKIHTLNCDPDFHVDFFAILLEFIIYIHLLRKKELLCHASSFVYGDKKILCPAWRNVGKTNLLLQFMTEGSKYIGDDWCILDQNKNIKIAPKRVNLLDYNLLAFPDITKNIDEKIVSLLEIYKGYKRGEYQFGHKDVEELKNNLKVRISPEDLFGKKRLAKNILGLDYVFYLSRNVQNKKMGVYIEKMPLNELINKIVKIISFEQTPFRLAYNLFKARTGEKTNILEDENDLIKLILTENFKGLPIYKINIPTQNSSLNVKNAIIECLNKL